MKPDDSISTTPESTLAALSSFSDREVILIAGGQDRGQEHAELARVLAGRGAEDETPVTDLGAGGEAGGAPQVGAAEGAGGGGLAGAAGPHAGGGTADGGPGTAPGAEGDPHVGWPPFGGDCA